MRNIKARVIEPNSIHTCHGSIERILYSSKVMPDGKIKLIESGKQNLKEYINSFAGQTDINSIIQRVKMGDTSMLRNGFYGDFTDAPKSYAEFLQLQIDGRKAFDSLPIETKLQFDNDFNKWLMEAGSDSWLDKMSVIKESDQDLVKDEVKADE